MGMSISLHLGGFVGNSFQQIGQLDLVLLAFGDCMDGFQTLTLRECHRHLEDAALPDGLLFTRDTTFPYLEVEDALRILDRSRPETKRVVLPPLLPIRRTRKQQNTR